MEQPTISAFKHQLGQTGMASVAFVASILPNAIYAPPVQVATVYENRRFDDLKFQFLSDVDQGRRYVQILEQFATSLLRDVVDTEQEIGSLTRKRFLDMYEDF